MALSRASTAALKRDDARRPGQALLVPGQQRHGLDQRLHDEEVVLVVGVGEAQRVAELGDPVLHLNARVHFHEEVAVAVDDALEGGGGVEADGLAEPLGLVFHAPRIFRSHLERARLVRLARLLGARDGGGQALLRDGHLEQLLLVHLQRAVATAQRDAPLAVAEQLDLVVAGLLDVELDQDVLVVADAGGLDLVAGPRAPARAPRRPPRRSLGVGLFAVSSAPPGCAGPCRRRRRWP